jgi:hypothetical protein
VAAFGPSPATPFMPPRAESPPAAISESRPMPIMRGPLILTVMTDAPVPLIKNVLRSVGANPEATSGGQSGRCAGAFRARTRPRRQLGPLRRDRGAAMGRITNRQYGP